MPKCINCGHEPCSSCGNWCDIIANNKEDLKHINSKRFFMDFETDDWIEWFAEPYHEDWFPILCCEGECEYPPDNAS